MLLQGRRLKFVVRIPLGMDSVYSKAAINGNFVFEKQTFWSLSLFFFPLLFFKASLSEAAAGKFESNLFFSGFAPLGNLTFLNKDKHLIQV